MIDTDKATTIKPQSQICYVSDLDLATALASIGVPLRTDPPFTKFEDVKGKVTTTFCFEPTTSDGKVSTMEMIKAWSDKVNFATSNPDHPFTYAICTLLNRSKFLDEIKASKPFVAYHLTKNQHIYVRKGTKKERALIQSGHKRVKYHG